MVETFWKLSATVVPMMNGFSNVVSTVHWECFANDGDSQARLYGAIDLPPPSDAGTYVDLGALQGADEASRRSLILSWANMLQPGFVTDVEAAVTKRLQAQQAQPDLQVLTLI